MDRGGGVHRPARRHGRLLRQRRGAPAPRAGGHAGDRRRRRQPGRGHLGHLRGPPLRRARGHAHRPGAAAVPDGDGAAGGPGALRRGLPVGHGAVPLDHPAGRAAEPGRGVPRRLRAPAAGSATPPRSASTSAPGSSTSRASPARSASPAPSSWPSWPPPASKPDGLLVVRPPEVMDFLHPLPVGALWGVGPKTEEVLLRLGLRTVGDLAHVPAADPAAGAGCGRRAAHLHELAWGRDPRRVVPDEPEKSTGHEETFGTDIDDPAVIHRELLLLAERTAGRLRSGGVAGAHGEHQGPLRRLRHDHPQPHPRRPHRRRAGALRHRAGAVRRPRARPGPDPAGRGARRAPGRRRTRRRSSSSSAPGSTAGGTPSWPPTGPPAGSVPARCAPPRCCAATAARRRDGRPIRRRSDRRSERAARTPAAAGGRAPRATRRSDRRGFPAGRRTVAFRALQRARILGVTVGGSLRRPWLRPPGGRRAALRARAASAGADRARPRR